MSARGSDAVRAPLFVALSCVGFLSSPALAEKADDAATKALAVHPMAKVSLIEPAPQRAKLTAKAA